MNEIIDVCSIHKYIALSSKEASELSIRYKGIMCDSAALLMHHGITHFKYLLSLFMLTTTSRSKQPKYFAARANQSTLSKNPYWLKRIKTSSPEQRLNKMILVLKYFHKT